jgi:hypothetical protein
VTPSWNKVARQTKTLLAKSRRDLSSAPAKAAVGNPLGAREQPVACHSRYHCFSTVTKSYTIKYIAGVGNIIIIRVQLILFP